MAKGDVKARVLSAFEVGGVKLKPNDVILVSEKELKALDGKLDADPAAVAAALSSGGRMVEAVADVQADESGQ